MKLQRHTLTTVREIFLAFSVTFLFYKRLPYREQ